MKLELKQNTPEWHELRRKSIGASDVAIILGYSPYKTAWSLWGEKLGIRKSEILPHMAYGHEVEERVRPLASEKFGMNFTDEVHRHEELEWAIASLDGYDSEQKVVLEIKHTNKDRFEAVRSGNIPDDWYAQMQWQMFVSGAESAILMAVHGDNEPEYQNVSYEIDFVLQNLEKISQFKMSLEGGDPPEMSDKDYVFNDTSEFRNAEREYYYKKIVFDAAKVDLDIAKKELEELSDDGNMEGELVRMTRVQREGSVDWKSLAKDMSIPKETIEKYRKEQIGYFKITLKKEDKGE